MCVQIVIKIYHMVEDLWQSPYFQFFCHGVSLAKKNGIWQVCWLDLVSIYQYAKNYQNIPSSLSTRVIFAN